MALIIPGAHWERATFSVPKDVSEKRVQFVADKYMRRYGDYLERDGFTVYAMERPRVSRDSVPFLPLDNSLTERDRRRYYIYALIKKRPYSFKLSLPDNKAAAVMANKGLVNKFNLSVS